MDSISFRGMRWNLLNTYDTIYSINLHGNSKKKETAQDGSIDQNVFDIMQGVSISIFVKTGKKKKNQLAKVLYYDLYGKRDLKYDFLFDNSVKSINWIELNPFEPNFFLVPKDFSSQKKYDEFIKIDNLLNLNGVGICSKRDDFTIHYTKEKLETTIKEFVNLQDNEARFFFRLGKDTDWKLSEAKKDLTSNPNFGKIKNITYRPFDIRHTYYSGNKGFHARPVYKVMQHFINGHNIGVIVSKKSRQLSTGYMFITNKITDLHILDSAADATYIFPLYLYPETIAQQSIEQTTERRPNLNLEIIKQIAVKLGLTFTDEKETIENSFAPIDILDYIYAVLHSPTYREKYKEFLKIDFPRVPYPKNKKTFRQLIKLGEEIRQIHLLESPIVEQYITQYPKDGDNVVSKLKYEDGKVHINDAQYFDNVPQVAWEFYIGGYQPAQKWLKDRKGRKLEFDDILHYQKIIVALSETDRLMNEIDKIEIE